MKYSESLQNCQSLQNVIELINKGGTSEDTPDVLAAEYAYDAAKDYAEGEKIKLTLEDVEAHLDILVTEGAKFDYAESFKLLEKEFK